MTEEIQQPIEVRFKHLRNIFDNLDGDPPYIHNKGGVSIAYRYLTLDERMEVLGEDEPAIFVGFGACSYEDNFCRNLGRKAAEKRLLDSKVVLAGERNIRKLLSAADPYDVIDFLPEAMGAQGLRLSLCLF